MAWGRWGSRLLVVGGLVGLLVVGWSYGRYQTVWGDTPCERDRALCDEVANVAAQRQLGWWYAACGLLLVGGLLATLVRRGLAPTAAGRDGAAAGTATTATTQPFASLDAGPAVPVSVTTWRVALSAAARAAAVAVGVLAAAPFWLFGGSALLLATGVAAVVVLAWLVDLRLRMSGRAGGLGALLGAGLAAMGAVVASTVVVAATVHWSSGRPGGDSWGWLLGGLVVGAALGAAAVVAPLVRLDRRGLRVAATAAWVVVVLAALVVVASPPGREALGGLQRDLYPPALAAPPAGPPVAEPAPEPVPTAQSPSPAPSRGPRTVPAGRACDPGDLTLSARGWDSAMGTSAVTLVVTNGSTSACWVDGFPTMTLAQAGRDLGVEVRRTTTTAYGAVARRGRVGLPPRGGEAVAALSWKGYRAMADARSPQLLSVSLPGATAPLLLSLDGAAPRIDVVEGAAMDLGPWQYPDAG